MTESRRSKLTKLLEEASQDEVAALKDTATFLGSSEAKEFLAKIESFRDRTIPSGPYDQIFGNILNVINSVTEMVNRVSNPEPTDVQDRPQEA